MSTEGKRRSTAALQAPRLAGTARGSPRRLPKAAIHVGDDRYDLDEPAAEAFLEAKRRRMLVGTGLLFVVFVMALLLSALRK